MTRTVEGGSDKSGPRYRDSSGKNLEDYPHPSVAVDTAMLTLVAGSGLELCVLEVRDSNAGGWCLPGTFLHEGERLSDAVDRSLAQKAGVSGLHPEQLHVFDRPDRDPRGWVLSVAHVDAGPIERLASRTPKTTRLAPVTKPGRLPYGHRDIIELALRRLRTRYAADPDPALLLPETFTLRELRHVHEAVAGVALQRDTFRRLMEPQLWATGDRFVAGRGRPAEIFVRRRTSPRLV